MTRWESLAGDTSQFAIKMAFQEDTSSTPVSPEMAASWGYFEIWVNGANLCAHIEEGEIVEGVHWYLLPLIEWLSAHWNAVFHEERLPIRNAGRDAAESLYLTRFPPPGIPRARALVQEEHWWAWRQRHSLNAAREGGLFPDINFRRWQDQLEVSWSNQVPIGAPHGFNFLVPFGRTRLDPELVASAMHKVAHAAALQLHAWEPESPQWESLVASLGELKKSKKQRRSRLDWLFQVGANGSTEPSGWQNVRDLFDQATSKVRRAVLEPAGSGLVLRGSSHAVLLFGSVAPEVSPADARTLASLLIDLFDESGDSEELLAIIEELGQPDEGLPWEQGYELADRVHQCLPASQEGVVDVQSVLEAMSIHMADVTLEDARTRGLAVAGPQHRPAVLANTRHPRNQSVEGRRFTLAHEFCHLLVDRRAGAKLAVASGPWAPVEAEQRANAFAAWFLMPPDRAEAVIAELEEPVESPSGIRAVAGALRTSPRATLEHLHNLGWLDEFQRDMLRGTGFDDESFDI